MRTAKLLKLSTALTIWLLSLSSATADQGPSDASSGMAAFAAGDFEEALTLWGEDARAGDPQAQFYLGYLYETGQGVATDFEEASRWYLESAAAGCRAAECNLGNLYMDGRGVATDHDEAVRRFVRCVSPGGICKEQRARMEELVEDRLTWYSEQNHPNAQYELASMMQARGAVADTAPLLIAAAEQGHGRAQIALADSYLNGLGVEADPARAQELLLQAIVDHPDDASIVAGAKSAMAFAFHRQAMFTAHPQRDLYVWARLAQLDHPDADGLPGALFETMASDAAQTMTHAGLLEAERLASRWKALFDAELPAVTVENLKTLEPPAD